MQLTARQKRFVAEYLVDQNATQAAIRAGYKKKNADQMGSRLYQNPAIKAAVEAKLVKVEETAMVDAAWVLVRLKEVVERCMQHKAVMEFDRDARQLVQATAVQNGEEVGIWEFDSGGANRALELLGRHLKLFDEATPLGAVPMVINIVPADSSPARNSGN